MGIYKYSYRFNASHNTSGRDEGRHTHSFEVVFYIKQQVKFFYETEKMVNQYMQKYMGAYLNDVMEKTPTIENMAETFFVDKEGNIVGETYSGSRSLEDWKEIVEKEQGQLSQ